MFSPLSRHALASIGLIVALVVGISMMPSAGAAPADGPTHQPCAGFAAECRSGASHDDRDPAPAPVLSAPPRRETFRPADAPQIITLRGSNFRAGVSVRMSEPGGEFTTIYSGASIASATDDAIEVRARFDRRGVYRALVRNSDGTRSNEVAITVK